MKEQTPIQILNQLYDTADLTQLSQAQQRQALLVYIKQFMPNLQDLGSTKTKLDIDSYLTSTMGKTLIDDFYSQTTLEKAIGDYLDWIGGLYGIKRRPNESDEDLKKRINELKTAYPVEELIITELLTIEGVEEAKVISDAIVEIKDGMLLIRGLGTTPNPYTCLSDSVVIPSIGFSFKLRDPQDKTALQTIAETLRSSYPNTPLLGGDIVIPLETGSSVRIYLNNYIDVDIRIYNGGTKEIIPLSKESENTIITNANNELKNFSSTNTFSRGNIESLIASWVPELQSVEYDICIRIKGEKEDITYPWVLKGNDIPSFVSVNQL